MKQKKQRSIALPLLLSAACLGFCLRFWQLHTSRDSQGLWQSTSAPVLALLALSVCAVMFFIFLSRRCTQRPGFAENFPAGIASSPGYLVGGVLLALSGLCDARTQVSTAQLLGWCALLPAASLCWHGYARYSGKTPGLLSGCLPVIWLIVRIIVDFKSWSTNPAVLDYCYQLFGLLCAMLGSFHTAGFSINIGKRRITLFWCMAGVYFCTVSFADGTLATGLTYAAFALILLQNVWCLSDTHRTIQTMD